MNRYRRLFSNTILFALSTFSSKVIVFFLMPLYTSVLTDAQYGTVELIVQAANLLIPMVSLGIMNAVVRFGLDRGYSKPGVFTAGVYSIACGYGVFLLFWPILGKVEYFSFLEGNLPLLYIYVLLACTRSLFSQFVRAKNYTRLYAVDGLLSTICTVAFNLLFLLVFKWGPRGYILAIISADAVSSLFLFTVAGLSTYFRPSLLKKSLWREMLRYALPMIPAALFWWVTNVSDRYMVTYMVSAAANGLYAVSYKIPTIVTLCSTIFTEAWQLSAVGEGKSAGRAKFFSDVFGGLRSVVFIAAAGLILLTRLIMRILVSPAFYPAWRFTPVLIVATAFAAFSNFLASIYMVEKKSVQNLLTTFLGAASNVAMNFWLIPKMGALGAAIATAASYLLVFTIRAATTGRYITIRYEPVRIVLSLALLVTQCAFVVLEMPNWLLWALAFTAAQMLVNAGPLVRSVGKMLAARRR